MDCSPMVYGFAAFGGVVLVVGLLIALAVMGGGLKVNAGLGPPDGAAQGVAVGTPRPGPNMLQLLLMGSGVLAWVAAAGFGIMWLIKR